MSALTDPRAAVILPWLAAQSAPAAAALATLAPDAATRAIATLEARWFRWAFNQTATWSRERVRAVFDHADRLVAEGLSRQDAERTALAAALADAAPRPPHAGASPAHP